jgi:gluconate 5-dehydrogenase
MNPFSLEGRTALVAGASRGIGLAIARSMAAAGARTVLAARSMEALEKAAGEIRVQGGRAEALALDVSDSASIRAAAEALPEADILINVAGINLRKRFLDFTREEYDRILETNLHGIFELTQKVGGGMVARGRGGKIVNIGSQMSWLGLPYLGPYAISKSGLAGMTRVLAAEWGRYNIQVNCIVPGFIVTDLNRHILERDEFRAWIRGVQGSPRLGAPEDIGPLAVFLSSPGSDYITGQLIGVDGGYSTTAVWPFEP